MKRSVLADNNRVRPDQPAPEEFDRFDSLRAEFFVDLSHQLRTPLTAMKLAIEGLSAQLLGVMSPSQRNLASISRRNIDRIISVVENQLDLLKMMVGDRRFCRRLVDIKGLVAERVDHAREKYGETGSGTLSPPLQHGGVTPGPLLIFTAPELLTAVVDGLLRVWSPDAQRSVSVDYHRPSTTCRIDVSVDFRPYPYDLSGYGAGEPGGDSSGCVPDFESRAYEAVLELAGGRIEMEKDENRKHARLYLPRYPDYDRLKDLPRPSGNRAAGADAFVVVEMGDDAGPDFLESGNESVRDVLDRCVVVTGDRDMIVRGGRAGTICLVLKDRTKDELEDVVSFLEAVCPSVGTGEKGRGPRVLKPDSYEADGLADELGGRTDDVDGPADEVERVT